MGTYDAFYNSIYYDLVSSIEDIWEAFKDFIRRVVFKIRLLFKQIKRPAIKDYYKLMMLDKRSNNYRKLHGLPLIRVRSVC